MLLGKEDFYFHIFIAVNVPFLKKNSEVMYRKAVPIHKLPQILSDLYYIQACKFPNGSKNHF